MTAPLRTTERGVIARGRRLLSLLVAPGITRGIVLGIALLIALGVLNLLAAAGAAGAETSTAPDAAEDRVLVFYPLPPEHFRPGSDYSGYQDAFARRAVRRLASRQAERHGLTLVDDWPLPLLGLDCYVMAVPAGEAPAEVAERLSREPNVAWAEPLGLFTAEGEAAHDDPLFEFQPATQEWRLAALHEIATGKNVLVAVVDSGIPTQHPDLIDQVAVRQNFVDDRDDAAEAHGAAVAGVIAARADNGLGVVGVAPDAKLMALRACWQNDADGADGATLCDTLSLAKALHFAIDNGAQVINLSLSGPPAPVLGRLLDTAMERNIVVVAAFDPMQPDGGFPASYPGVVPVSDQAADRASAANTAALVAPGRDVPTTEPNGGWSYVSGSSYSAAHVSGLFALLRQHGRSTSASLVTSASGAIDACQTMQRAASCFECACAEKAEGWTSAQQ